MMQSEGESSADSDDTDSDERLFVISDSDIDRRQGQTSITRHCRVVK